MVNIDNLYKYCADDVALIENYDKAISDDAQIWVCHHRLEIQGNKILSKQYLIEHNLYYHRPASELILLTHSQHVTLHNKNRAEETFVKISIAMKGNKNCLGRKLSIETKQKISNSCIGISAGIKNPMYGKHHSEETRQKMSKSLKGHVSWNKGGHHSIETRHKLRNAWVKRKQRELESKYNKSA